MSENVSLIERELLSEGYIESEDFHRTYLKGEVCIKIRERLDDNIELERIVIHTTGDKRRKISTAILLYNPHKEGELFCKGDYKSVCYLIDILRNALNYGNDN